MIPEHEYFKIFNNEPASLRKILDHTPNLEHAVSMLIHVGRVVGQRTLGLGEPEDVIILSNEKEHVVEERVIFEQ